MQPDNTETVSFVTLNSLTTLALQTHPWNNRSNYTHHQTLPHVAANLYALKPDHTGYKELHNSKQLDNTTLVLQTRSLDNKHCTAAAGILVPAKMVPPGPNFKLPKITQYGSTVYIGIAMVYPH